MKIGAYPTPIERHGSLWIKRDDLVSPVYGGNKVRRLERLLADARSRRKRRIVTMGAAGSHHVLATALFGAREGFEVEAVVVPQPGSDHARANLRAALAQGLQPVVAPSWKAAAALVRPDGYRIPVGGSSPLGALGYVDAAIELAAQVRAGVMPRPDAIVFALGSGGMGAGLAVGLAAAGLDTRAVGIAISGPFPLIDAMARRLVKQTAKLAALPPGLTPRLEIDRRWIGRGYGYATPEGERAAAVAASYGLVVDRTYTAKAFAAALALAAERPDETILFWHTLSSAPMEPLLAHAPPLSPEHERLFT